MLLMCILVSIRVTVCESTIFLMMRMTTMYALLPEFWEWYSFNIHWISIDISQTKTLSQHPPEIPKFKSLIMIFFYYFLSVSAVYPVLSEYISKHEQLANQQKIITKHKQIQQWTISNTKRFAAANNVRMFASSVYFFAVICSSSFDSSTLNHKQKQQKPDTIFLPTQTTLNCLQHITYNKQQTTTTTIPSTLYRAWRTLRL